MKPTHEWITARAITDAGGAPYAEIETCAPETADAEAVEAGAHWTLAETAVGRREGFRYLLSAPFATVRVWCRSAGAAAFAGRLGLGTEAVQPEERTLVGIAAHHGIVIPMTAGVPATPSEREGRWTGDEGRFWEQMAGWPGARARGAQWPDPRARAVDAFAPERARAAAQIALPATPALARAIPQSSHGFTDEPLALEQLSRWLARFAKVRSSTRANAPDGTYAIVEKGMPQAGALRTGELWLALEAVTGLSPGLYRYDDATHALEHRNDDARQIIADAGRALGRKGGTPAGIALICVRMKPLLAKYRGIALSLAMTNAGVCLAAAQAAAAREGMVARGVGAIPAKAWLEASGEDPRQHCPLAALAIGRNSAQSDDAARGEARG